MYNKSLFKVKIGLDKYKRYVGFISLFEINIDHYLFEIFTVLVNPNFFSVFMLNIFFYIASLFIQT